MLSVLNFSNPTLDVSAFCSNIKKNHWSMLNYYHLAIEPTFY